MILISFVVEAAANIARHLEYHPQALSLAAATMHYKGTAVKEYSQMLDAKVSLGMLGSAIDQSPVTRTILRISAMLSTSIIPLDLFTATGQVKQIPERFTSIFADMKSEALFSFTLEEQELRPSQCSKTLITSITSSSICWTRT